MCRKTLLVAVALAGLAARSRAADARFLRMWESAQRQRPAHLVSSARIAPEGEPGTPMVVRGLILLPKGRPAAGTGAGIVSVGAGPCAHPSEPRDELLRPPVRRADVRG